ncbi:hypothetical protein AQUCO_00500059v1 [Aquilegia coerulea]|uniref:Uncharacterized protein n=1 Tax=Aquilegia coerulea TaxID=218851 RepID=A0A2G5EQ48_AQUCA|nr:hypothetical protein AQUCO_00500059v1 [Aquilegia coerulea]
MCNCCIKQIDFVSCWNVQCLFLKSLLVMISKGAPCHTKYEIKLRTLYYHRTLGCPGTTIHFNLLLKTFVDVYPHQGNFIFVKISTFGKLSTVALKSSRAHIAS